MSDPFNQGLHGQAPPAGGRALDNWAAGASTRQWNQQELARQAGSSTEGMLPGGGGPLVYATPPDPRILKAGLFMAYSFIAFCLCAPIFGTLYPLTTAAAVGTTYFTDVMLRHSVPGWAAADRVLIEFPVGVLAFWIASRLDHRVAAYVPPYRYARHFVRVILVAVLIATASLNPEGSLIPTNARELHAIVSNPLYLPFIGVMAVIAQIGLTKWKSLRGHWDWGLEVWRLRPKGLPR